jgi:hypothetical protein
MEEQSELLPLNIDINSFDDIEGFGTFIVLDIKNNRLTIQEDETHLCPEQFDIYSQDILLYLLQFLDPFSETNPCKITINLREIPAPIKTFFNVIMPEIRSLSPKEYTYILEINETNK